MLTAVGKKLMRYTNTPGQIYTVYPYRTSAQYDTFPAIIAGKKIDGSSTYFAPNPGASHSNSYISASTINGAGVAFGSGTTSPTENDYTIENKINGISATPNPSGAYNTQYDSTNNDIHYYCDFTVNNTGNESITISEICKFTTCYYSNTEGGTPASSAVPVLVDRTLLDSPVTIAAGEAAVIRYEFIVSMD